MSIIDERLSALATKIGNRIAALTTKVLPSGGAQGDVLEKSTSADYQTAWVSRPRIAVGDVAPDPANVDVWIDTN